MIASLSLFSDPASASDSVLKEHTDTLEKTSEAQLGFGNGSFILAPIPLSNPALGNGLVAVGAFLFKTDAASDTSFIGIAKMKTDNGSEATGIGAHFFFGDGKWEVQAAYGQAKINYSVSGVGRLRFGPIPITQEGTFGTAKLGYGVTDNFRVGLEAAYLDTTVRLNGTSPFLLPALPGFGGSGIRQLLVSPALTWDTRDDNIYPTSGYHAAWKYQTGYGLGALGNTFIKNVANAKGFVSLGEKSVLALDATLCNATNRTPFFNQCAVGVTDSLRGYGAGEFFDTGLFSVQAEYRHRLKKRWGVTIFGGASVVGPSLDELGGQGPLYAGGVGLRYRLSKKFPLDFSVDFTINADSDSFAYIYVGQAF